jgi:hypothetical protein
MKIMQITATTSSMGNARRDVLYGLDERGQVWQMKVFEAERRWLLMPPLPEDEVEAPIAEAGFTE